MTCRIAVRSRRCFLLSLLLVNFAACWSVAGGVRAADDEPAVKTVQLVIDYGDGVEKRFRAIRWRSDMTVLDVMKSAQEHPRGIKFSYKGSGAGALLTTIDDLQNEGRGRNWIYEVNGKLADRSFAVQLVAESDTVLWEFRKYR